MTNSPPRHRVVQWATGNIGTRALREVIRHPSLDLVGLLVYDPAKDGVDAGTLCGEEPVGVKATTDRAAIHALGADCVLYMPRVVDLDDVVAFLEAGTNVVTTCGAFFDGGRPLGDERRSRVLDACARGGASVYDTGSSPGFITEILPFALLSLQRHVESIAIEEFANMSQRNSPHMIFELMGFGRSADAFNGEGKGGAPAPRVQPLARRALGGRRQSGRRVVEHGRVRGGAANHAARCRRAPGGDDRRDAHRDRRPLQRRGGREHDADLVLHHRHRAGVGPRADRMARPSAR